MNIRCPYDKWYDIRLSSQHKLIFWYETEATSIRGLLVGWWTSGCHPYTYLWIIKTLLSITFQYFPHSVGLAKTCGNSGTLVWGHKLYLGGCWVTRNLDESASGGLVMVSGKSSFYSWSELAAWRRRVVGRVARSRSSTCFKRFLSLHLTIFSLSVKVARSSIF